MTNDRHDWRADFRLHAMDLETPPAPEAGGGEHWILQDKRLSDMLADLEKAHQQLLIASGQAPEEGTTSAYAILHKLGYADQAEPDGFLATARFVASFVAACVRENFWVQREVLRLRMRARPRLRKWRSI
jgi:hypothetical protein